MQPLEQIDDAVMRVIAPNPGLMTGPGTNGYLIGHESLLMVDPGPAVPAHLDHLEALCDGRLHKILVTHTHRDHSPAAMALAERTGADIYGMPPPETPENDRHFAPDHVVQHEQWIECEDERIQVIHTPGHASNHVCFLLERNGMLFTGDHIMNGSTVVIVAPDGNMKAYLDSLALLRQYPVKLIAPGHGDLLREPMAVVDWIIDHRLQREAKVVEKLQLLAPAPIDDLLPAVYDEVDARLLPIARYSLDAHLGKLREDGVVRVDEGVWSFV